MYKTRPKMDSFCENRKFEGTPAADFEHTPSRIWTFLIKSPQFHHQQCVHYGYLPRINAHEWPQRGFCAVPAFIHAFLGRYSLWKYQISKSGQTLFPWSWRRALRGRLLVSVSKTMPESNNFFQIGRKNTNFGRKTIMTTFLGYFGAHKHENRG